MIIKTTAKNGQATLAVKAYDELTTEERQELIFPYGTSKEDYVDYKVFYNKKGEIVRVRCGAWTKAKSDKVHNDSLELDVLDACQIAYGYHGSKARKSALEKFNRIAEKRDAE